MTDKTYYGSDFSFEECEAVGLLRVNPKLWKGEAGLFKSKWFDYRDLHPVKATYLFANMYSRAYRRLMCRRVGIEKGQYHKGFRGQDIFMLRPGDYSGFWKARQMADQLGIPYDFYNNFVMRWATDNLWKRLPRPTMLYSEKMVDAIKAAWDDEMKAAIQVPQSERYLAENFEGHQDQYDFQFWLCGLIKKRPNPHFALATYMYMQPMLVEEVVNSQFEHDIIRNAGAFAA